MKEPREVLSGQLVEMARGVDQFQREIMDLPCAPRRLPEDRKRFRNLFMLEELNEYKDATTQKDEVDALIDLIYVAVGDLLERGVDPLAAFSPVQDANMAKVRGETSRGAFYDAKKPDGWRPPDHEAVILDLAMRQAVRPALIEATKIVLERGAAYNGPGGREEHFPFGVESIFQMMWVKMIRMKADILAGRPVNRDHPRDLINYSDFMMCAIDGRPMQ